MARDERAYPRGDDYQHGGPHGGPHGGGLSDRVSRVAGRLRQTKPPQPPPPARPARPRAVQRPPLPTGFMGFTGFADGFGGFAPARGARSHAPVSIAEPVNTCWLARSSRGHVVLHGRVGEIADGFGLLLYPLPDTLLAITHPGAALIMLNARLFPALNPHAAQRALLEPGALGGGLMERLVEGSRMARLVVALAWLRWHQWPDLAAAQLGVPPDRLNAHNLQALATDTTNPAALIQPYAIGWGVARSGAAQRLWSRTHAATYTLLWKRLAQLLAPLRQLDAQSQLYLGLRDQFDPSGDRGQMIPFPAFNDRRPLVWQVGRSRGATDRAVAEQLYISDLAERSRVPETLIRSRLEGDWSIPSLEVWTAVSDALVAESGQLAAWRADLAARHGIADERSVALFVHEPALALTGPNGELLGAPHGQHGQHSQSAPLPRGMGQPARATTPLHGLLDDVLGGELNTATDTATDEALFGGPAVAPQTPSFIPAVKPAVNPMADPRETPQARPAASQGNQSSPSSPNLNQSGAYAKPKRRMQS